jgi:kumamolisin
VSGLLPLSKNPDHRKGRGLPDVAGDADPETGYQVIVDGVEQVIGGTSAVAPLWAGLIARLNQELGTNVGYLNPLLYARLAPSLHDITKGDNGVYVSTNGWDPCTGWGSPNGNKILSSLGAKAKAKSQNVA